METKLVRYYIDQSVDHVRIAEHHAAEGDYRTAVYSLSNAVSGLASLVQQIAEEKK